MFFVEKNNASCAQVVRPRCARTGHVSVVPVLLSFLSWKGKPRKGTDASVVEAKAILLTESRVAVEARYKPPSFSAGVSDA